VGGIQRQIIDGVTGHLVEPLDADAIAARMAAVLDDEDAAAALGREGREHVRRNFLLPELVKRYLILMRYYLGRTADVPPFTYREVGNGADTRACSSA